MFPERPNGNGVADGGLIFGSCYGKGDGAGTGYGYGYGSGQGWEGCTKWGEGLAEDSGRKSHFQPLRSQMESYDRRIKEMEKCL